MTFESFLKAPNFPKTELRGKETEMWRKQRSVDTQGKACDNFHKLKNKSSC